MVGGDNIQVKSTENLLQNEERLINTSEEQPIQNCTHATSCTRIEMIILEQRGLIINRLEIRIH